MAAPKSSRGSAIWRRRGHCFAAWLPVLDDLLGLTDLGRLQFGGDLVAQL